MATRMTSGPVGHDDPEGLRAANRLLAARLVIEERFAAASGRGLAAAVRCCHELTGVPAALVDGDGRMVCQFPVDAIAQGSALALARTLKSREDTAAPLPAGPAAGLPRRVLARPVLHDGQRIGWLILEERGTTFDPQSHVVIDRGAHQLATEYLIQQRIARVAADARDALTRQLAKGSRGLGDLRASAEYLGVDIDARRVLVHILDPLVSNDEPEPEADHRLVVHLSRRLGVEILHTRGSEGVLLLIEVDRALREHDVISRVRTAVSRTLVECCAPGAVAGVSRACEPADFAAAYREAREVARCVQRLGDGSGAFVLAVDDLGPARLFLANADTAALRTYVDGLLGPLLSGAPGMAELLLTTQVWLDCGRSIRATAARLGLHENTIRLRLARVEKFTGVDVSDTNGQLALQTGVLLLRLQGHPALARLDALDEGDPGRITA